LKWAISAKLIPCGGKPRIEYSSSTRTLAQIGRQQGRSRIGKGLRGQDADVLRLQAAAVAETFDLALQGLGGILPRFHTTVPDLGSVAGTTHTHVRPQGSLHSLQDLAGVAAIGL